MEVSSTLSNFSAVVGRPMLSLCFRSKFHEKPSRSRVQSKFLVDPMPRLTGNIAFPSEEILHVDCLCSTTFPRQTNSRNQFTVIFQHSNLRQSLLIFSLTCHLTHISLNDFNSMKLFAFSPTVSVIEVLLDTETLHSR